MRIADREGCGQLPGRFRSAAIHFPGESPLARDTQDGMDSLSIHYGLGSIAKTPRRVGDAFPSERTLNLYPKEYY